MDARPAAADGGIHHLNETPMTPPQDDEMRKAVRLDHDRDGGQRARFLDRHMIHRQQDLFGLEPELIGGFLDGVDGRTVDVSLAGLAEAAVVGANGETFEQGFQRRRAAIHVGGLDNLRHDEPAVWRH